MPSSRSRASAPPSAPSTPTAHVSSSWRGSWPGSRSRSPPSRSRSSAAIPLRISCSGAASSTASDARSTPSPPRPPISPRCSCWVLAVAVGGQSLQFRRGRPPRPRARPGAEGKAPDLQRVLRRPHLLARRPGLALDADGLPLGDFRLQLRLRHARRRRCARTPGRPMARCAGAVTPARRSSSTSRPLPIGWGSTPPGARCWPRASGDNAVRAALRQRRRRPGRPDLRRRRVRVPERPPGDGCAAVRGRLVVHGRRSRPHAPPAHREHHLARRLRRVPCWRTAACR